MVCKTSAMYLNSPGYFIKTPVSLHSVSKLLGGCRQAFAYPPTLNDSLCNTHIYTHTYILYIIYIYIYTHSLGGRFGSRKLF